MTTHDDDFLPMTLESSDDDDDEKLSQRQSEDEDEFDEAFEFDRGDEDEEEDAEVNGWSYDLDEGKTTTTTYAKSLNEIIERRREKKGETDDVGDRLATGFSDNESDSEVETQNISSSIQPSHDNGDQTVQKESNKKFYASTQRTKTEESETSSFMELNLSRPLLRAVTKLKYQRPTPIQAQTIPLALQGRDVCASAQTGSGKTAAFLLPTFERMLFRADSNTTRVLVITPTRELATQIHSMATSLTQFTSMRIALVVGGLALKKQEVELRTRPDIVICKFPFLFFFLNSFYHTYDDDNNNNNTNLHSGTPGRMIDLLRNSLSVHVDDVEVLILDEADRLLDEGFKDEIHELVRFCPKGRQTLLFSTVRVSHTHTHTYIYNALDLLNILSSGTCCCR